MSTTKYTNIQALVMIDIIIDGGSNMVYVAMCAEAQKIFFLLTFVSIFVTELPTKQYKQFGDGNFIPFCMFSFKELCFFFQPTSLTLWFEKKEVF